MTQRERGPKPVSCDDSDVDLLNMHGMSILYLSIGSPTHRPIVSRLQSSRGYVAGNWAEMVLDVGYGHSGLPIACAFQLEAKNLSDYILEREDIERLL